LTARIARHGLASGLAFGGRRDRVERSVLRGFLIAFGPLLRGDASVEEDGDRRVALAVEIGELHVSADGRLGDRRPSGRRDVLAPAVERDESPVVPLLDLGSDRMVVALCALNARAEDRGREALGDRLVIVAVLEREPARAGASRISRAREDDIAGDLAPRPVLAARALWAIEPAVL